MLKVLLLLSLATSSVPMNLSNVADIVMRVQRHFYSRCVVLLKTRERLLQPSYNIFGLEKLLAENGIMTSLSNKAQYVNCCQHKRPLYVIMSSGLEERQILYDFTSNSCMSAIWLLFLNTASSLQGFFANISIPFDCEFLVAQEEDDHVVVLTEVYRVSPSLPLQTYRFGEWTQRGGMICVSVGLYQRRTGLQGAVLKTAVKNEFLTDRQFEYSLRTDIFFNQVWLTLERLLDFRSELKLTPENVYGKQMENGSWDGVMGMMARGEVDATSVELTMEPMRSEAVDYIAPLINDREYLFIKNHNLFETSWTSFLQPFDCWLWVAIFATMLLLSASLFLISQFCCLHEYEDKQTAALNSFSDCLFAMHTALCHQGFSEVPQCISGRLVCAVTHFTMVVILAAYSASLVSYLAFRQPVLPFSTFSELLNDSTYQLGVHAASYLGKFDMEGMEPALRELYLKQIASNPGDLPDSNLEGFRRVCSRHKYTFLSSLKYANRYAEEVPCKLSTITNAFIPETNGMALVKGSPYLGLFRQMIHKLRATGILQRLKKNVDSKLSKNKDPLDISMDFISVTPIFGILIVGLIGAVLILLTEFVVHRIIRSMKITYYVGIIMLNNDR
ncbi:hypothetical protein L798_08610 [Zootermopsis nevadensis]|uniref:Ionotropic glutamate receptor C-terminal domain-containing protein n=1 Tax=Zootermopsis nevadensis TaxID=136037 RepID=A0A067R422_ZOONE|nr:hypothetical protein L798_08610 [Zootermopsis nevadensis]